MVGDDGYPLDEERPVGGPVEGYLSNSGEEIRGDIPGMDDPGGSRGRVCQIDPSGIKVQQPQGLVQDLTECQPAVSYLVCSADSR